jgi:hypothetical protein
VLAIGAGAYPQLNDKTFGLQPISSPPVSAVAFARWLEQHHRLQAAPLSTIELLAANTPGVTPPTMDAIRTAFTQWYERCDSHPDNVAVFYFAGHAFERGDEMALLADDFGKSPLNLMSEAIYLKGLELGMARCRARRQCFFIDACRELPQAQAQTLGDFGVTLIQPHLGALQADRDYSIYYATASSAQAYGRTGQVSRFTSALLRALEGAGADDREGPWVVLTSMLHSGIAELFKAENQRPGVPFQLPRLGGSTMGFVLHELARPPQVPVFIGCDPAAHNANAQLRVQRAQQLLHTQGPASGGWELLLEPDRYDVSVQLPHRAPIPERLDVRPPIRSRRVRIQP